jgi:hypothetical protein
MFRQLTASFNVFPSADVTMFSIFVEYQRMRKLKKLIKTKKWAFQQFSNGLSRIPVFHFAFFGL